MKDFVITTDSNSDLLEDYIKDKEIGIIPHYYDLEGVTYGDEVNLTPKEFYDKMRGGIMPTTMASNPEVIRRTFQGYVDRDLDILHISFSSALSGGCSNVMTGGIEICEENPGAKIIVLDTLNASMGEGMLVMKAVELKEEGKTIDEIAEWIETHKLEYCVRFVVDDLGHLQRGGRISKTTAFVGSMINVKPILYLNNEGQLVPLDKARGRKKSLTAICDNMMNSMGKFKEEKDIVCIAHGDDLEDAMYLADLIKERLPHKTIIMNTISPSIGAHSGPGAIGLCFRGEKR
ncbi:DegV family protein [Mobilitalea sibirica]|uniref:DegV family protein n=1 Tax=Mobilitalea sibirica TaxID=1462919 RepID=A0A8J7HAM2_9FIRM|nr:DegV family protein [Mobilitalea sibirica]MBH1940091.1 DegV family protein [Mobilitalea sibirica]